jgi:hypothetical protein
MEPLYITDLQYGGHDQGIQSFGKCFAQNWRFLVKS